MDTTDLVLRAQNGDRQAMEDLYFETYRRAYTVVFKMTGNEADAYDILQDAYETAFKELYRLYDESRFELWLYRTADRACVDFLAQHGDALFSALPERTPEEPCEEWQRDSFHPADGDGYAVAKRHMNELLTRLPNEQKLVWLMFAVQEMDAGEIAAALELEQRDVEALLNDGADAIREQARRLEENGEALGIADEEVIPFLMWFLHSVAEKAPVHEMDPSVFAEAFFIETTQAVTENAAGRRQPGRTMRQTQTRRVTPSAQPSSPQEVLPHQMTGYAVPPAAPEPPKSHVVRNLIISLVVVLLLAAGAVAFIAFALPQITGEPNVVSEVVHKQEDINTPEQVVRDFETAVNNNDRDAMAKCFLSDQALKRNLQGGGWEILNNLIDSFGQDAIKVHCVLTDLNKQEDTASGTVRITAEVPIFGTQEYTAPATFQKKDRRWYFKEFLT